jgi:hypothetical protein
MPDKLSLLDEMVVYSPMEGFHKVELGAYPDGMPLCTQPGSWCYGSILTVLLRPKSFASFVASMFWVDALNERHPSASVRLVLPFIPGAGAVISASLKLSLPPFNQPCSSLQPMMTA